MKKKQTDFLKSLGFVDAKTTNALKQTLNIMKDRCNGQNKKEKQSTELSL